MDENSGQGTARKTQTSQAYVCEQASLLLFFLFQGLQISEKVVDIGLCELIEQFAMRSEWILQLHLDAIARERTIPTGRVAQRNHEIVSVLQRAFDPFTRRQCHQGRSVRSVRVQHARLEIDG